MIQTMAKEPSINSVIYLTIAVWLGMCLLSLPIGGWDYALGIFLGGAVVFVNFNWMHSQAVAAVTMSRKKASIYMVIKYLLRLGVTAVIIYALMVYTRVKIPALLIGISTVIISIFAYMGFSIIFNRGE
jgi:hypothetical protein